MQDGLNVDKAKYLKDKFYYDSIRMLPGTMLCDGGVTDVCIDKDYWVNKNKGQSCQNK